MAYGFPDLEPGPQALQSRWDGLVGLGYGLSLGRLQALSQAVPITTVLGLCTPEHTLHCRPYIL
jgi:hypothetical protein